MATIYDVARLAGVSTKTVSRVLNEEPLVAEETKRKVKEVIAELDYYPNAMAARLKRQRANIAGFVVPYGSEFVFQDLNMMEQLRGAHDVVTQAGYDLIISAPVNRKDALQEILRLVKHKNVDGVILYPVAGVGRIISELDAKHFKYVTLGIYKADQKTNFVNVDVSSGGYQATKYLLGQGHRFIAMVNKPNAFFNYFTEDMLLVGYKTALAEMKLPVREELLVAGDYTVEGGYQAFKKLWKQSKSKPTAVICASDPMTYGAIRAIEDLGFKAGKDIEVVAGDNLPLTRKLYPGMPALCNPAYEQGRAAGKMLLSIINQKKEMPGITLRMKFMTRNTELKAGAQ
ncbi:MAG TPA: LacI family DNA-binding transcriptional regulator [Bacillota bacterium]